MNLCNNKPTCTPKDFFKNTNLKKSFVKIFNFKDEKLIDIILTNWNLIIDEEISYYYNYEEQEKNKIRELTLLEVLKIFKIGKYSVLVLKMKPEFALAFSLGIYYANVIFEGNGICLNIEQIYEIIPGCKKTDKEYKLFEKKFFLDGTKQDIIDIIYKN